MDFDFNLILVPVTLVFFIVWLLDKLVWKQRETKGKGNENTYGNARKGDIEYIKSDKP